MYCLKNYYKNLGGKAVIICKCDSDYKNLEIITTVYEINLDYLKKNTNKIQVDSKYVIFFYQSNLGC